MNGGKEGEGGKEEAVAGPIVVVQYISESINNLNKYETLKIKKNVLQSQILFVLMPLSKHWNQRDQSNHKI